MGHCRQTSGLFLLGDKPHPPSPYRVGRLPLRGHMHTPTRTPSGGRMPLHTCDRTRADGLSTPLRGVLFYQQKKIWNCRKEASIFGASTATKLPTQNTSKMSNPRIDLLKEVKTTVNSATFAPSEQRIKAAKAAISQLINYVDSLEVPASKPSKKAKSQPKAAKPKASKSQPKAQSKTVEAIKVRRDSVSGMYQVTEGETVLGEYKKRKTARAMATKFSKAEGQPKAVVQKPKASKKSKTSNRRAKLNSNQRLEVQQAKANVAESYTETPKQSAKQNKPKVAEVPFELTEGQCPIEAARHAKHLAMQDIFDIEMDSPIFEEDITFDDLSGQINLF